MVTIYLEGGGDIKKRELKSLDFKAINKAINKNMIVLDFSTDNLAKREKYYPILRKYFKDLGVNRVDFASKVSQISPKKYDLMYLPGGDTEVLLKNIKQKGYEQLISDFKGIIIGNSAGALVLCKKAILLKNEHRNLNKIIKGLGLLDFAICVHYTSSQLDEVKSLNTNCTTYLIPENTALVWSKEHIDFIGDILKL